MNSTRIIRQAGLAVILLAATSQAFAAPQTSRPGAVRTSDAHRHDPMRRDHASAPHRNGHGGATDQQASGAHNRLVRAEGHYRSAMAELRRLSALAQRHGETGRAEEIDQLMVELESRHELHRADLEKGLPAREQEAWKERKERLSDRRRDQADREAEHERRAGNRILRTDAEEDDDASRRIDSGNMDRTFSALRRRLNSDHGQFKERHPHHREALQKEIAKRKAHHAAAHDSKSRARHAGRPIDDHRGRDGAGAGKGRAQRDANAAHGKRDHAGRDGAAAQHGDRAKRAKPPHDRSQSRKGHGRG